MKSFALATLGLTASCCLMAQDTITNAPAKSFLQRDTLTGDWGGARSWLAQRGIDFSPVYTGEVVGDVSGGKYGTGAVYDHSLNLPLTLDLEKLAGWKAATFHANAFWIAGQSLSENCVGDIANVSNISGDPALRLQELWLQQNFWEQTVLMKAGLIAVDSEFFTATSAALFINGSFGAFPLVAANLPNPPVYPMAAPAVRLLVQPAPRFYFQAAIFDGNAGTQEGNPDGTGLPLSADDGALIFSEIGFLPSPDAATNRLATAVKAGAFIHTRRVPTWNSQAGGATGGGLANYGFYAVGEQDLFRRAESKITAFVRGGFAPADRNVVDWYLDIGFNFIGYFSGRPDDVAGIAFARSNISRDYSRYGQSVNSAAAFDSEMIIEASYRAQILPWWTLQPDLQYVFTPGGDSGCRDAVVIGLRTQISF
jgi:porin